MSKFQQIVPVLLAGGSGTRLWPTSRKAFPKQFGRFGGEHTLFQQALLRFQGSAFARPLVLTSESFRFLVGEQAGEIGFEALDILVEPEGRDTAPAILAAAIHISNGDPGALMLVAAADHVIPDPIQFQSCVTAGMAAAAAGSILTFGIQPDRAETGYGWLELAADADLSSGSPLDLIRFVEKPVAADAQGMLESGNFLWNSGIFMFSAREILAAYERHAPKMVAAVSKAVEMGERDLGFLRLNLEHWKQADKISVDFAIMERATNLKVLPYSGEWTDLGDWQAVWRSQNPDGSNATVLSGDAEALDCEDTYLHAEGERMKVVGLGLKNIVAVATNDAVLVADKSRTQDVKKVVAALREKSDKRANEFPADQRPWGSFESLAIGGRFQVKRIIVKPGGILSLQSHVHRAEHWIVVEGTARVTIDEEVKLLQENQSVYIPLGAIHRLENPGKVPLILIEVQTGAYLGEDDIVRYEDVYKRT